MERIFRFFAERHTLALVLTLSILGLGLSRLMTIRRDVFPQVQFGEMVITTSYPGAAPEDVELNVTNEIEDELESVTGIDRMTSYSMENISMINVVIDPDVDDLDEAIREVREAVARVTTLPPEVDEAPEVLEIDTAIFPVIEVGLLGGSDYAQLRDFARQFEKKLERVRGVARVERFGYRDREVRIQVDPEAIDRYDIPLRGVVAAIQARNVRASGGSFESYTGDKNVVTLAEFATPQEVGDVIVRASFDGPAIKVKDLARIEDGYEDVDVDSRMNGRSGISFLLYKKDTADAVRTVDAVRALVEEERPYLPEGVEVAFSDDFSRYVRNRMRVVMSNGAIGLGLVLILLGTFLSVRSAIWTAMGIPVAILGTVFMLPLFDQVIDIVGMAAMVMVIGIVVDDAIIVAENIHRKRELGLAPLDAAAQGVAEVYRPVLTTVLTTVVAFAPMFFMSGIMGKIVWVVPLVMTLALVISLLEVTVALPAHLIAGARKRGHDPGRKVERGWFHAVRRFYRRTIFHVLRARYGVVALSFALLAGGLLYAKARMDFVLFPSSAADLFYIRMELPRGTSLEATSDKVREVEELVAALPEEEVESYVTRLGHQDMFLLGQSENWAIIAVYLTPATERQRIADEMVAEVRAQTDRLQGYDRIIYYIDAGGPPVGSPVTLRVVGGDAERRTELADSVVAFLASFDGVSDIDRNDKLGKDQVEIDIDYERLSRLGLTVAAVARTVRTAYDGEVVTSVRYGDEDVDFRVVLDERARSDPALLDDLLVPNDRMRMIPLGEVARLRTGPGTSSVYHYDGEGAIMITTDVKRDVVTPLEVTRAVEKRFDLTGGHWRGLRFVIGGEAEETQESVNSLIRAFTTAVIAIYLILVLLFNSAMQPLFVMTAIPLGVIGVIAALAVHGQPLSFMAMMGLIGLSGVVVNDSLVLVNHINTLRKARPGSPMLEIVSDAASERLRAIVLTTLTTVAGLLPLAYGIGGSDPFIAPMVLAMGFGLLFASPVTLALVPSLYLVMNDVQRLGRRIFRRRPPAPGPEEAETGGAETGGARVIGLHEHRERVGS